MHLNEAIVFKKDKDTPIAGLIITETLTNDIANKLLDIIKNNQSLKLYFYHRQSKDHIVRYVENKDAQSYLKGDLNFNKAFSKAFFFKGFDQDKLLAPVGSPQKDEISVFKKIYQTFLLEINFFAGQPKKIDGEIEDKNKTPIQIKKKPG